MNILRILLFLALIPVFKLQAQSLESEQRPLQIGHQLVFQSRVLQQERLLNVYLPESYHPDSTQRYPVIYLLDGSMFEDFLHIVGITQFESYPWIDLMPECIVVGISNVDRKHDFTYPTTVKKDLEAFPTTGGSAEFITCLSSEIQPLIESTYRCSVTRVLIGQSLGGLLASEILLKKPELFTHYLIVSPSLWWDKESLLELAVPAAVSQKKVCIAVGSEGSVMIRTARTLNQKLTAVVPDPENLSFIFMPEFDHGDILHQAAYKGLAALFSK
jgi:hypothetical protein